jgi:hypothetical protein
MLASRRVVGLYTFSLQTLRWSWKDEQITRRFENTLTEPPAPRPDCFRTSPRPCRQQTTPLLAPTPLSLLLSAMSSPRGIPLLSGPPTLPNDASGDISCRRCAKDLRGLFARGKRCNHCGK